jgi:hypothetical protein
LAANGWSSERPRQSIGLAGFGSRGIGTRPRLTLEVLMGWDHRARRFVSPASRPATKAELQAFLVGMKDWAAKNDAALATAAAGAEAARVGAEGARVAFREYCAFVTRFVESAIREAEGVERAN